MTVARRKKKTWHGFVGPIGAYIPDSPTDVVYSVGASLGAMVGTRIALNLATTLEIPKMASHHYVGSRVAVRAAARKQVGKWTIARGLGLAATSTPFGAFVLAATILSSLPPSGMAMQRHHQQTDVWFQTGSGYDPTLVGV